MRLYWLYFKWGVFALLSFIMNLWVWTTCWLWALIPATFKLENLPGPLWYMQTHDDWVYGFGWPKENGPPPTWWGRYKLATWWLARNPGYAFDTYVLGLGGSLETIFTWFPSGYSGFNPEETEFIDLGYSYRIIRGDGKLVGWGYRKGRLWLGWHFRDLVPGSRNLKVAV